SQAGKLYTIGVILVGVGVVGFTLSNLTAFLVGGQIQEMLRAGKRQKMLSKLKNHYIVCGAGRMGYEAVRELSHETKKVVVIDNDEETLAKLEDEKVLVLRGDATDDDTLRKAGVEHARGLLATLPEDADNVYVALSARGINSKLLIIARGTDTSSEKKLLKAGANRVILPYQIGGRRMATILLRPEIDDFLELVMGKDELSLKIEIVPVVNKSSLDGITLKDSNIRQVTGGAMVMGMIRTGGEMIPNPPGDQQFFGGDQLIVIGKPDQLEKLKQMAS
ncbi:TrkA family potassium uptake protein, partial [bacterium]|nr:TrkA family potassium uptake protein [bacterium]